MGDCLESKRSREPLPFSAERGEGLDKVVLVIAQQQVDLMLMCMYSPAAPKRVQDKISESFIRLYLKSEPY